MLPVVSGALGESEVWVVSAIHRWVEPGDPVAQAVMVGGGSGIGGRGGWTIGVACFDSNPIMGRVFVRTSAPGDSLGSAEPGEEHEFFMGVSSAKKGALKCF